MEMQKHAPVNSERATGRGMCRRPRESFLARKNSSSTGAKERERWDSAVFQQQNLTVMARQRAFLIGIGIPAGRYEPD